MGAGDVLVSELHAARQIDEDRIGRGMEPFNEFTRENGFSPGEAENLRYVWTPGKGQIQNAARQNRDISPPHLNQPRGGHDGPDLRVIN